MSRLSVSVSSLLLAISIVHIDSTPDPGKHPIRILPQQPPSFGFGTLAGFSKCGGTGEVYDWRVAGCSPKISPCEVPSDTPLPSELDFLSLDDARELEFKFFVKENTEKGSTTPLFDFDIYNSAVMRGANYTLFRVGKMPGELVGKTVSIRLVLINKADNKMVICAQSSYKVRRKF